jgi:Sulfotransferase domain
MTNGPRGTKIFGIGLSRTGTSSLNDALVQLGYSSVHFPSDSVTRAEIARQLERNERSLRLSLLDEVVALTDTPVCCVYQALDAAYQASRFILTVRDEDDWLRSCEAYWQGLTGARRRIGVKRLAGRATRALRGDPSPDFASYVAMINRYLYGDHVYDRDRFLAARRTFEAGVYTYFQGREESLLTLDICKGQGWPELCSFLSVAEPPVRFPWSNATTAGEPSRDVASRY